MDSSPRTDRSDAAGFARPADALRASEARYRALSTASADVIYRMSPDWREMRRLDGRGFLADTAEPIEGWLERYILPEDRAWVMAAIEEAIRDKRVFELEHRVVRADGATGWTFSRAVPLLDDAGEIIEWIGAASDISARKEAEAALRASEARLRRMMNVDGVGMLVFEEATGTLLDVNDAFLDMTGYARDRVAARALDWRMLTPPEYIAASEAQMAALHEAGRIGPYEKEYIRADGSRSWLLFAGASLGNGTVVEYCADINDRKRAEAALHANEERQAFLLQLSDALRPLADPVEMQKVTMQMLVEHLDLMRASYFEIDADEAGATRTATYETSAAAPIPNRFFFSDFGGDIAAEYRAGHTVVFADTESDPRIAGSRATYRAMGVRAWVGVPLVKEGRVVAVLGVHSPDTREWTSAEVLLLEEVAERTWSAAERARAEAVVRESEERQREARERDALRRQLVQAEEEERRRLARELHDEAGQHLTALGLGLQALSNVALPGSEIDRRTTELRALANTLAVEMHAIAVRLRPKALDDFGLEAALAAYAEEWARHSGIEVDLHAAVGAERLPTAVETAVYRVVQEALTNIARHSGAKHAGVVVERREGHVVAVVEDDGRGFPVPDSSGAPLKDLAGLGLLGIRERVALLGGTLDVEATPGSGTTLFVRVPLADAGAVTAP
ncbi:MAG TPA: PAS domain S-box protein [Gemmatimonadaceae bacterium]